MDEEVRKRLTVPFYSEWYRCESCEPKKRKDGWILHFSGKVTPYKVGFDTYKDFLNLDIQIDWAEGPGDDVVEFLRKWGPLGLWYKDFVEMDFAVFDPGVGLLAHTSWQGLNAGVVPFEEYWTRNHTRKLRIRLKDYPKNWPTPQYVAGLLSVENVLGDYFESWNDVHRDLWRLQRLWKLKNDRDIALNINFALTEDPLEPLLVKVPGKPKKYEWSFAFKTLSGALTGLIAQEVIGKVDMRECKNCGTRFDAIATGRTTFCCTNCLVEYPDKQKREDPVIKYRRMLQRRLERRREVSDKKSRSINAELLAEKSVDGLKTIEDKYPVILGKKK